MKEKGTSHLEGVMIIDPDKKITAATNRLLANRNGWRVLGSFDTWEVDTRAIAERNPGILFVNMDAGMEAALQTAVRISAIFPWVVLLGVSESRDKWGEEGLLRGLRAGYRDFLRFPFDPDEAIAALSRIKREQNGCTGGKIITLFSPRGGYGLTTLAVNLAVALAKQDAGKRVGLLDLDLEMGDVSFFLNLSPALTLADLIEEMAEENGPPEPESFQRVLVRHPWSGVEVLAGPHEIVEAEKVTANKVGRIIEGVRGLFDFVVINTAHNFSPVTLQALDASDKILLLTIPHLLAVQDCKRTLGLFKKLGYDDRVRLLVNRVGTRDEVLVPDIEKALGLSVSALLPSDYFHVASAINRGLSLLEYAPRTPVARTVMDLPNKLALRNGSEGDSRGKKQRRRRRRLLFLSRR